MFWLVNKEMSTYERLSPVNIVCLRTGHQLKADFISLFNV